MVDQPEHTYPDDLREWVRRANRAHALPLRISRTIAYAHAAGVLTTTQWEKVPLPIDHPPPRKPGAKTRRRSARSSMSASRVNSFDAVAVDNSHYHPRAGLEPGYGHQGKSFASTAQMRQKKLQQQMAVVGRSLQYAEVLALLEAEREMRLAAEARVEELTLQIATMSAPSTFGRGVDPLVTDQLKRFFSVSEGDGSCTGERIVAELMLYRSEIDRLRSDNAKLVAQGAEAFFENERLRGLRPAEVGDGNDEGEDRSDNKGAGDDDAPLGAHLANVDGAAPASADVPSVVRGVFAAYDGDADGTISAAELRPALAKLGLDGVSHAEAEETLRAYDFDGDRRLDLAEFGALISMLEGYDAADDRIDAAQEAESPDHLTAVAAATLRDKEYVEYVRSMSDA